MLRALLTFSFLPPGSDKAGGNTALQQLTVGEVHLVQAVAKPQEGSDSWNRHRDIVIKLNQEC